MAQGTQTDKFRFEIAPEQYVHEFLINRCLARPAANRDAPENNTLSWTYSRGNIMHASLNVSYDSGSMLEVTEILRDYYATRPELRKFAAALATTLRERVDGEGRSEVPAPMALPGFEVNQTLKPAPLFLLCAAVNEHPPSPCPRSRSLDDATSEVTSVNELYERLGCFPAHELGVLVDAQARTMTTFSR